MQLAATLLRELLDASWRERRMTWMFPYGVIELKLSTDALENMLVRIDRLRAESHLEAWPDDDDGPDPVAHASEERR